MTISLEPTPQAAAPRLGRTATLVRLALIGAVLAAIAGALCPGLPQSTPAGPVGGVGLAPMNCCALELASLGWARENAGRGHRVARGPGELDRLAAGEGMDCIAFWAQVADVRARTAP